MTPDDIAMAAAAHAAPHDYGHPEVNAMARIAEALATVDEEAHGRILRWVVSRFEVEL